MLAVAMVILWSSGFIGAELGTRYAPAHTLLQWRYVVAIALLAPFVLWRRMRTSRAGVLRHVGLGLAMQCVYLGFVFSGIAGGVSSGIAALIAALQPLVVAAVAGPLLGEYTGVRQRIGLAIGIVGVAVVVVGDVGGGNAPWWMYLLPVAGMLSLSAGTVAERRMKPTEPLALSLLIQCATGAVFFSIWGIGAGDPLPPMTGGFWLAVMWTVFLSTFGGLGLYLIVVRRTGATKASVLLYLTPPTTLLWAWLMFGNDLTIGGFVGLAVCAAGVSMVLLRSSNQAPNGTDRAIQIVERDKVVR
ncbi:membrane protein [Rhodococcoides trifolii]|uniref:Membrane protein n=2 Tax=Rhodococcoides trifolii TaxID=908250 RepID=A0A917LF54_9NOCA|nr:membrane protein [Rhodococcus trifolii]